ncbi:MAG: HEPN domain-containing protein [Nanoarchaeota archaeon]|nr:HEPN domain-containing protein [Nanoarchaeota archaeon]
MQRSRLDWCLSKEDRLRRIRPDEERSMEHINKAKHNLLAADYNAKGGFDDWAVSQSYYAMYHSLLAVLYKNGFESKNHECTISAVEHLIRAKKIDLDMKDIIFIRTAEQMKFKDAKSLREEFQYGTKTDVNKEILDNLISKAKEIVEKIELILNM